MPGSVQSIERAAAVLRLLAGGTGPLALGEVARSLGLAKGTVHGILRTLQKVGFVEQDLDSGRYRPGADLLHLGSSYLDANELRSLAINWADPLAARSHEAVRIGMLVEDSVLVVHHVFRPDDSVQTVDTGSRLPAHACALGKALLAFDAHAAACAMRRPLAAFSPLTLTLPSQLAAELTSIRARGWALEYEELRMGEAGLAAVVRDPGGLVVGAIGVSGPVDRLCGQGNAPRPALLAQVCGAADAIARELAARRR